MTRLRRSSATLLFSKVANVLNASLTSVSTFAVALGVGNLAASPGRELFPTTTLGVETSFVGSRLTSSEAPSLGAAVAGRGGSVGFEGAGFRP